MAAPLSERRTRRLENEANRVELRVATSMPPSEAAATTSQLATPRGMDNNLSDARDPGSTSTLGMFSSAVSTGLDRRSTPTRRVLQRTTAAFITSACRRRIRRARVLRIPCVEKSLSRTLCARPHSLTSRRRLLKPSAISLLTTRMRMQRSWIGCPTSRSSFTRRCGREFVASSIQKPTRNDSLRNKWTTGRVWMY